MLIRFNRPEVRSPLSVSVIQRLMEIVSVADERVFEKLVFTGVGDVFASGADLREIAELRPDESAAFARRGQDLMRLIAGSRLETIPPSFIRYITPR